MGNKHETIREQASPRRLWVSFGNVLGGLATILGTLLALVVWPFTQWETLWLTSGVPADPAIEFDNRQRSDAFGGIDRWAYPGQGLQKATTLLTQDGWHCRPPDVTTTGQAPTEGTHTATCSRGSHGLLFENQRIQIAVRYHQGLPPRVVSAHASVHPPPQGFGAQARGLLARAGLVGPAELTVHGWVPTDASALVGLLMDRMPEQGWWRRCGHQAMDEYGDRSCPWQMVQRAKAGIAPVAPTMVLPAGSLCAYERALADIGFQPASSPAAMPLTPTSVRWHQRSPLLAVGEVGDSPHWFAQSHWTGADLAGTGWTATLTISAPQGQVSRVRVQVGQTTQEFSVAAADQPKGDCDGKTFARMVRLAPPADTVVLLYWAQDDSLESLLTRPGYSVWEQMPQTERDNVLAWWLSQPPSSHHPDLANPAAEPKPGALIQQIYDIKSLWQRDGWLPPLDSIERMAQRPDIKQPWLLGFLVLAHCGAGKWVHGHEMPGPDASCWHTVQAQAPLASLAAKRWLDTTSKMPKRRNGAENAGKPGYYTIVSGDTLTRISLDKGQRLRDIVRWNNIENPNWIGVGKVLLVVPPSAEDRLVDLGHRLLEGTR